MAKKALINKSQRKPKFAVRAYTRCNRCGRPHLLHRVYARTLNFALRCALMIRAFFAIVSSP